MIPTGTATAQEDFAMFAEANGLGQTALNLFAGVEPDEAVQQDVVATFINVGAESAIMTYGPRKPAMTRPRVRVYIRSKNFGKAQDLAIAIHDLLYQANAMINGTFYQMVRPLSDPVPFGPDENNRQQIGFTVRTIRSGS